MRSRALSSLALLFAAGCVGHADVMVAHPLTSGGLMGSVEIEKPESMVESQHGLPMGSLTQRATLVDLDGESACFKVQLHGLRPDLVDVRQLKVELSDEPGNHKMEGATVISGGRATPTEYDGLVPHREMTGHETYCTHRDARTNYCEGWATRPTYSTTMVPGMVTVYESSSKICFSHDGLINPRSERVVLDLFKLTMAGWMPMKTGVSFRWGFTGALKGKEGQRQASRRRDID